MTNAGRIQVEIQNNNNNNNKSKSKTVAVNSKEYKRESWKCTIITRNLTHDDDGEDLHCYIDG